MSSSRSLPFTTLSKQLRASLLSQFNAQFVEEFLVEYQYLCDVAHGNAAERKDKDLVGIALRISWSLLHFVPIAGSVLAGVVPCIDAIMKEVDSLKDTFQPLSDSCDTLKDIYDTYDEQKEPYKEIYNTFENGLIDREALRLLAESLADLITRRYEFAIVNLLSDHPEKGLVPLAQEGARKIWQLILDDKSLAKNPSELLAALFNDKELNNSAWSSIKARWARFNKGTNLDVRQGIENFVGTSSLNNKRIFICAAFYDNNNLYKASKRIEVYKDNPSKYGYAWIAKKEELPHNGPSFKIEHIPTWLSEWQKQSSFYDLTEDDFTTYLATSEMKKAAEDKQICSLSFADFLYKRHSLEKPIFFICNFDLSKFALTYGNYQGIQFIRTTVSGDLSHTSFQNCFMPACTFKDVFTADNATLNFSHANLKGSTFTNNEAKEDKGLISVNFSNTKAHFVDFSNTLLSLDQTINTQWHKANVERIRIYKETTALRKEFFEKLAEQAKATQNAHEIEEKRIRKIEYDINTLYITAGKMENSQMEILEQEEFLYRYRICSEIHFQSLEEKVDDHKERLKEEIARATKDESEIRMDLASLEEKVNTLQTPGQRRKVIFTPIEPGAVVKNDLIVNYYDQIGSDGHFSKNASTTDLQNYATFAKINAELAKAAMGNAPDIDLRPIPKGATISGSAKFTLAVYKQGDFYATSSEQAPQTAADLSQVQTSSSFFQPASSYHSNDINSMSNTSSSDMRSLRGPM